MIIWYLIAMTMGLAAAITGSFSALVAGMIVLAVANLVEKL